MQDAAAAPKRAPAEDGPEALPRPAKSAEAVQHEGDTRLAKEAALRDHEAKEVRKDRHAAIFQFVIDNDCFGHDWEQPDIPDKPIQILAEYEASKRERKPDYDITKKPVKIVARVLEKALKEEAREIETAEKAEIVAAEKTETISEIVATKIKQEAVAEAASYESFRNSIKDLPWEEQFNLIAKNEAMPKTERDKARTYVAIQAAAQTEADAALIASKIEGLPITEGLPDPVSFAQAFIFDSPDSVLSTGVSEATQEAVAELLGIERPAPKVVTGSDMTDLYTKGVGTRTVRDPETGKTREEPVYLQPGEFVAIRKGEALGLTEDGHRALKLDTEVGSFVTLLPDNAGPEDMVQYGLTGQMMSQLHEMNMAEIFFPGRSQMERGGGVLEVRMPDDFNRTQQLCQIFFGAFAGYDGELLNQADLDKIPYLMQFHNRKGDYAIGDVNPEQMRADFRAQGVLDKSNTLNMARFEELVQANRAGLYVERNFALQNAA